MSLLSPLVLGQITTNVDLTFEIEKISEFSWQANKTSAFANVNENESEQDIANRLQSIDESRTDRMLEEYSLTHTSTLSPGSIHSVCFQVPADGRVSVYNWLDGQYVIVYTPYDQQVWAFSSSKTTPNFKRAHGNSWLLGKDVNLSPVDITGFVEFTLLAFLMGEENNFFRASYPTDQVLQIFSQEQINIIMSAEGEVQKRSIAWRMIKEIQTSPSNTEGLDFTDIDFSIPVKQGSLLPITAVASNDPINIKMGVAHIPRSSENNALLLSRKWIYFDSSKILRSLDFIEHFTDSLSVNTLSDINSWYPLASLSQGRIKAIQLGHLVLHNPPQTNGSLASNVDEIVMPVEVISSNNLDEILCFPPISFWCYRWIQNIVNFQRNSTPFTVNVNGTDIINSFSSQWDEEGLLQIKLNQIGDPLSYFFVLIPRMKLFTVYFRENIKRICEEENTFWHITNPQLKEYHQIGLRRVNIYKSGGLNLRPSYIAKLDGQPLTQGNPTQAQINLIDQNDRYNRKLCVTQPRNFRNCIQCWPWSATFISYVIKRAASSSGVGNHTNPTLSDFFNYSALHINFVRRAFSDRDETLIRKNYWLYGLDEDDAYPLQVGDLLVRNSKVNGVWTNIQYPGLTGNRSHSDLIIRVRNDRVVTCGGNVLDSVNKRTAFLDTNMKVSTTIEPVFGDFTGTVPTTNGNSRYFAVMKLRNIHIGS